MPRVFASGLIMTPVLRSSAAASLSIKFEPAMIISARKVDKLGVDIRSFREPLKRSIQRVIIPSIRRNFDAGGRDPKWAPLAPDTIKRRAFDGYGPGPILIKSGRLRRTMGYLNIWTIDREKAYIQDLPNSVWYGKVHQAGATFRTRGEGNIDRAALSRFLSYRGRSIGQATGGGTGEIPARPFVVLRRRDEIQIQKIFNDWLGERVRAAGLSSRRV